MMSSFEVVDDAILRAGVKLDPKLRATLALILELSLRKGYNQAVKDWKEGKAPKEKDINCLMAAFKTLQNV